MAKNVVSNEDDFRFMIKMKKASRGYNDPSGDFIEAFSGNPFSSITPKS
jgi:hypothetical protein